VTTPAPEVERRPQSGFPRSHHRSGCGHHLRERRARPAHILLNRAARNCGAFPCRVIARPRPTCSRGKPPSSSPKATASRCSRNSEISLPHTRSACRENGPRLVTSRRQTIRRQDGEVQYVLAWWRTSRITRRSRSGFGNPRRWRRSQSHRRRRSRFQQSCSPSSSAILICCRATSPESRREQKLDTILQASERGADLTPSDAGILAPPALAAEVRRPQPAGRRHDAHAEPDTGTKRPGSTCGWRPDAAAVFVDGQSSKRRS